MADDPLDRAAGELWDQARYIVTWEIAEQVYPGSSVEWDVRGSGTVGIEADLLLLPDGLCANDRSEVRSWRWDAADQRWRITYDHATPYSGIDRDVDAYRRIELAGIRNSVCVCDHPIRMHRLGSPHACTILDCGCPGFALAPRPAR